jgi:hypothetical protein
MSTRKLILTALLCGLAILVAGGVKLFQVANDEKQVEILYFGDDATLGDMTVSVVGVERTAEATFVTVTMTGVDLVDGAADGWRLLADGRVREPLGSDDPNGCRTVDATEATRCTVLFESAESAPTVAYVRAGEQRQWAAGTP